MLTYNYLSNTQKLKLARRCFKKGQKEVMNSRKKSLYMIIHARLMIMYPASELTIYKGNTWNTTLAHWRECFKLARDVDVVNKRQLIVK